jgi:small-conductance mechanosensitive channel
MTDVRTADTVARRRALIVVGCSAIAGALLILATQRYRPGFEDWLRQDLRSRTMLVFAVLSIALTAPIAALAAYLWRLSRRVFASALVIAGVLLLFLLWRVVFQLLPPAGRV